MDRNRRFVDKTVIVTGGTVEDVANLFLFLASDEAAFCTGACYRVDGALLRLPILGKSEPVSGLGRTPFPSQVPIAPRSHTIPFASLATEPTRENPRS